MVTLYNAASADGFIARKDGSEDFLPDEVWDDFLEMLSKNDAYVMGRKTYETLQGYPKAMLEVLEAYKIKRVIVSRDADFDAGEKYSVISDILEIPKCGKNVLISSGPGLNTVALRAGIIDRVVLNIVPESIGKGIPVFDEMPNLELLSTIQKPMGRNIYSYKIKSR
ncbi:MAG: dihydrofolate reductase family protein [bacterium]